MTNTLHQIVDVLEKQFANAGAERDTLNKFLSFGQQRCTIDNIRYN